LKAVKMRIAKLISWLVWTCLWSLFLGYLLFITRPDASDLPEQLTTGDIEAWLKKLVDDVAYNSIYDKLPSKLSGVSDFYLFTVIYSKARRYKNPTVSVGVLSRFWTFEQTAFVWNAENDILFALLLHVLVILACGVSHTFAFHFYSVRKNRPWTFLKTTFLSTYPLDIFPIAVLLTGVCQTCRDSFHGRHASAQFWTLYVLVPAIASLLSSILVPHTTVLGYIGGVLAVSAYGALAQPTHRFDLFGVLKVGYFGIFLVEACHYLVSNASRRSSLISPLCEIAFVAVSAWVIFSNREMLV